jgi:DNA-binding PadR family transcriptional regulator
MADQDITELLPLKTAVFHVLLTLAPGELHGYGIMQGVRELSSGLVDLKTGPFYRHLKWLLEAGLVQEVDRPDHTDPRRGTHYGLTLRGREVLTAESQRLSALLGLTRRLGLI